MLLGPHNSRFAVALLLVTGALVCLGGVSSALADTGVIAGARAGVSKTSDYDIGTTVDNLDDSDFGWEVFAGYQFFDFLAFEASYVDLGELTADGAGFGGFTDEISAKGWNFAAKGMLPLSPRFGVHATVGAFVWQQDVEYTDGSGTFSFEDTGTGMSAGAGIHVNATSRLKLEVDATRYFKVGDPDNSGHESDRDFIRGGFSYFFDLAGTSGPAE